MHIVCCVKQVPDTTQVKIDPETNTLIRAGVESICNPYDLVAVEAAVQLTEKYGGRVSVISMGPPQAESALRECLSLGASEAVLLSDRAFAGADTLATSYTLSQAIARINAAEPVDLVICGKQAIDGDTAQTGPGIATWLGYTQLTYVSEIIGLENNAITVKREVEGGCEIIEGSLPALLTVELELSSIRYATLPELIRALRQEVKVWGAKEIDALPERLGLKGSPTSVREIFAPPVRGGGTVFDTKENKEQAIDDFLETLFKKEQTLMDEILSTDSHAQE
ncbi:MAG: electron transfer flavoprotein subunit beta/FixA family protein [Dehalococcoidales bacterium]|nr:electron transfer flavoprotein subunit beta/FixA family protein [Dehalococcoidales bacterium]